MYNKYCRRVAVKKSLSVVRHLLIKIYLSILPVCFQANLSTTCSKYGFLTPLLPSSVVWHQHFACEHIRGYGFYPVFIKIGQSVCLFEILDEYVTKSHGVRNEDIKSNFRKTL